MLPVAATPPDPLPELAPWPLAPPEVVEPPAFPVVEFAPAPVVPEAIPLLDMPLVPDTPLVPPVVTPVLPPVVPPTVPIDPWVTPCVAPLVPAAPLVVEPTAADAEVPLEVVPLDPEVVWLPPEVVEAAPDPLVVPLELVVLLDGRMPNASQ